MRLGCKQRLQLSWPIPFRYRQEADTLSKCQIVFCCEVAHLACRPCDTRSLWLQANLQGCTRVRSGQPSRGRFRIRVILGHKDSEFQKSQLKQ